MSLFDGDDPDEIIEFDDDEYCEIEICITCGAYLLDFEIENCGGLWR